MTTKHSQLAQIEADLVARKPVNSVLAFEHHHITRLSSIIQRLINKGFPIESTQQHGNGIDDYALRADWQPTTQQNRIIKP